MRDIFVVCALLALLTGCNTSRRVTADTKVTEGSVIDSASASTVAVDSAAWLSASGTSTATSTQYAVVTDVNGMPVMDASGKPITYIVRRDTVTKVVAVEHYTTASMVTHDTVHVFTRDTLSLMQETKTVVKVKSDGWWGVVWRLIVLIGLLIGFRIYVHCENK